MKPTSQARGSVMNFKLPALVLSLLILAQTGCVRRAAYTTIVYEEDGTYTARDGFGNLLPSVDPPPGNGLTLPPVGDPPPTPFSNPGDDPAPLLQAAFDRQGDIYVAGGSYDFNGSFTGLRVRSFSRITIARDATFIVPRGFSNALFTFESVQATTLEGGFYREEPGPGILLPLGQAARRHWTLFRIVGGEDGDGTGSNVIRDIRTWYVGTVIELATTSPEGWANGNRFSNFSVFAYRVGIDFSPTGFFQRNLFDNLIYQPHPVATAETGARNIRGLANTFFNVYFYDALRLLEDGTVEEPITGNIAEITSEAEATLIIGGIMTQHAGKFVDNGVDTQIIDELHRQVVHVLP